MYFGELCSLEATHWGFVLWISAPWIAPRTSSSTQQSPKNFSEPKNTASIINKKKENTSLYLPIVNYFTNKENKMCIFKLKWILLLLAITIPTFWPLYLINTVNTHINISDHCRIRWEVGGWEFHGRVADRFVTNPEITAILSLKMPADHFIFWIFGATPYRNIKRLMFIWVWVTLTRAKQRHQNKARLRPAHETDSSRWHHSEHDNEQINF